MYRHASSLMKESNQTYRNIANLFIDWIWAIRFTLILPSVFFVDIVTMTSISSINSKYYSNFLSPSTAVHFTTPIQYTGSWVFISSASVYLCVRITNTYFV